MSIKIKKPQHKQPIHERGFKNMISLDNANEANIIKRINDNDRKKIIELRSTNKLTQEDLAKRINVRKEIIRDIENGSYFEDKQLFSKIIRFLSKLEN